MQGGVAHYGQLKAAGLGVGAIEYRVRQGRLHRVLPSVYAVGRRRVEWLGLIWAAVLSTGGVASHRSAARLWGVLPHSPHVEITARTSAVRRGVIVHRNHLPPEHVTEIGGLAVTRFIRTLVDLADVLTVEQLVNVINEAEVQRRDFTGLQDLLGASAGRHGIGRLRAALERYATGITRSGLERRFLALVESAGLPRPRMNAIVEGEEVDAYWATIGLVVEIDSQRYHRTARKMASDRARDRKLRRLGHEILRFMDSDIAQRADEVVADLSGAARARRAGASSASRR